jgi:hypothetical protein
MIRESSVCAACKYMTYITVIAVAHHAYVPDASNRKEDYYLEFYHRTLQSRRLERISRLEIGVADGAALKMWHEYFPNAQTVGLDKFAPHDQIRALEAKGRTSEREQGNEHCLTQAVNLGRWFQYHHQ